MGEDWLERWRDGLTGWHEEGGNSSLRQFWPKIPAGSRVLVPLCGKSPDLLWLAEQGHQVIGVELAEIAVRAFFEEAKLPYAECEAGEMIRFSCNDPAITLFCGDYFKFFDRPFDALYDRASLIALPAQSRPDYARHTADLLKPDAVQLLITLEYDRSMVDGPPFAVLADEVSGYWKNLQRVSDRNVIDSTPPKFRDAGLTNVNEAVWLAA